MKTRMALSHSRLSDFNQCPLKFKLKYIDKESNFKMKQDEKSIHLIRGGNIHEGLENYLIKRKDGIANITTSLPEVEQTIPIIEKYIGIFGIDNLEPEEQVAIDDNWNKVAWFSKNAYFRAIFDLIGVSPEVTLIADYKTGKFKDYAPDGGMGQLELSAAIALSIYESKQVKTAYLFVDHKKSIVKTFERDEKNRLVDHFESEHLKVNKEVNFDPKKNQFCNFCDALKDQCKMSRKL